MKLKSGLTLWAHQNPAPPRYPKLRADVVCDVAIIGGGISGALVAHELMKRGCEVVVVDKRAPGKGSTSASTALLLYETDTSLAELTRRHGRAAAVRVYALGRRAIREIGGIARSLRIDCGFVPRKSLYLASDRKGLREIKKEFSLRRRVGFSVSWLTRRQLRAQFGLDFLGALYAPGSAQIDVVRFTQRLLAHHARRRRIRIFQNTKIVRVDSDADRVRLRSAEGHIINARHIVVATGYEAAPFLEDGLVQLHSSYVIASRPRPGPPAWKEQCLIWETARPYFYLRTTDDHRIVIGGADEPFANPRRRDAKLARKTRVLVEEFSRRFPHLAFDVEFAWTGTFGETVDGLPYIGARKSAPRIFYALGYGGNGITFSQIAARIIGALSRGQKSRDAFLFRLDRESRRKSGTGPARPPQ